MAAVIECQRCVTRADHLPSTLHTLLNMVIFQLECVTPPVAKHVPAVLFTRIARCDDAQRDTCANLDSVFSLNAARVNPNGVIRIASSKRRLECFGTANADPHYCFSIILKLVNFLSLSLYGFWGSADFAPASVTLFAAASTAPMTL